MRGRLSSTSCSIQTLLFKAFFPLISHVSVQSVTSVWTCIFILWETILVIFLCPFESLQMFRPLRKNKNKDTRPNNNTSFVTPLTFNRIWKNCCLTLQYQKAFPNFPLNPTYLKEGSDIFSTNSCVWIMAQLEKWKLIAFFFLSELDIFIKAKETVIFNNERKPYKGTLIKWSLILRKTSEVVQRREVTVCSSFHINSVPRSHKTAGEKWVWTSVFWPAQTDMLSTHIFTYIHAYTPN